MKDYIERAAALNETQEIYHWAGYESRYDEFVSCEDIRNIPAADVVEVVRCGECRHAEDSLVLWCTEHEQAVSRLDFCSHGARMDKEDEHEAD